MIDTIVLDIANDTKYKALFDSLIDAKKTSWTEFMVAPTEVDLETGAAAGGSLVANELAAVDVLHYVRSYRLYNESGTFAPVVHASDIKIPSWDYKVNIHINGERVRFTFSIPKYLYGTNVLQFCSFDHSVKELHRILLVFLQKFFSKFHQQVDFHDVEVRQIDLCYNQFFHCESDALRYLDAQKKLVEVKSRINAKGYSIYKTSFQYLTQYYNFKVYAKGAEFLLHDKPRLDAAGKQVFAAAVAVYASRILRYEMSFKHSAFNMLFREYFFRGNQKHYSNDLGYYVEKIAGIATFCNAKKFDEYKERTRAFTLKSNFDTTREPALLVQLDTFPFSRPFLQLLHHYFMEKIYQYEIKSVPSIETFINRVEDLNRQNDILSQLSTAAKEKKRQRTNMRLLLGYFYLRAGNKFSDLREHVSGSTLKDLRKDLKKLGIDDAVTDVDMPAPSYNYLDYELMCKELHLQSYFLG